VLRDLTASSKLIVVLVEQNARSSLSIAKRAVVINLGRVVVCDDAATVAGDTELRHHYLGY
jgi:branched-chain amino acid transport system ATP-binding protein